MPILLPKPNAPSAFLIQLEDRKVDLEADTGAVGRIKVREDDLTLDIKGQVYDGKFFPSNSLLIVSIGGEEAQVEQVCNSVVQLQYKSNVFDHETTEGDLDESLFEDIDGDLNQEWRSEEKEKKKEKKKAKKIKKEGGKGARGRGGKGMRGKGRGRGRGGKKRGGK